MPKAGQLILAIETSCDETAVAILEDGVHIRANLVASQIAKHQPYGGVVPELASRCHTEVINVLIEKALSDAQIKFKDLDAIAVTHGPGLVGALLVGLAAGKALAAALNIPLIAVNHLRSHVYSNFLVMEYGSDGVMASATPPPHHSITPQQSYFNFPYLILLVSGGHTQLIEMKSHTELNIIAETTDDAAGEAFDKVARLLELGYPGGPAVQKAAEQGNASAIKFKLSQGTESFSFSGIKTAVSVYLKKNPDANRFDIAASFQKSVVDTLVHKTIETAKARQIPRIMLCGGVAANKLLRESLAAACQLENFDFSVPKFEFCTDNAAMVGCAGFFQWQTQGESKLDVLADPNLVLA